ncbi:TetR/AcrR family transcriptional regulator [Sphingobium yanoikuyae]|jgi:AcrR family transcriptional regulator|uniref:TetR/AcrR family transcriptional regulator n=1 Tax=Sphingobium yanoikuyae TaxID=13690 RepID=UPI00084705CE|nr:TetR/AcrR family transcriptional regulator [Sphingobium yanoikuyae]
MGAKAKIKVSSDSLPEANEEARASETGSLTEWDALLHQISHRPKRVTERKQDRSKRTEQQIMGAALRVFARDGISRVRIADIAAEAGISTSTLYEYYKSKEDLAYDVPLSHLAEFFEGYRVAVADKVTAREKILLYLSMSADYAREHAEWARILYLEIWPSVFVNETELRHSMNDFSRVIVFLVRKAMAEGSMSADRDAYETAAMLVGSVNQVIITWLLYRRPRNLTKAGTEMAERLLLMLENEAVEKS